MAGSTRAARWLAALKGDEPERPGPLPGWVRPLVRTLVGGRRLPTLAHGPATRRALTSAGASAAAWAGTVHLPRPPRETPADLETIAHEVTHLAQGVRGPRFFEGAPAEAGESDARSVGRLVRRVAEQADVSPPGLAARTAASFRSPAGSDPLPPPRASVSSPDSEKTRRVQQPPASVGSGRAPHAAGGGRSFVQRCAGGPGEVVRRPRPRARKAERQPGVGRPPAGTTTTARGRVVASYVPHGARHETAVPALETAALPVGGAAAVMRALSPSSVLGGVTDVGGGPIGDRARMAAVESGNDAIERRRGAVEDVTAPVGSAAGGAPAVEGLLGSAAGAATDPASQMGDLLEAIEERVLVELERRGGRFAGTF